MSSISNVQVISKYQGKYCSESLLLKKAHENKKLTLILLEFFPPLTAMDTVDGQKSIMFFNAYKNDPDATYSRLCDFLHDISCKILFQAVERNQCYPFPNPTTHHVEYLKARIPPYDLLRSQYHLIKHILPSGSI